MTILDVMRHQFAEWFSGSSWNNWRVFLKALFCLAFDEDDTIVYQRHTKRSSAPAEPFREAWLVVGRRGGKSLIASFVAVFLACFRDYREYLKPGECGTVMVIASDRRQARTILRYIRGFLAMPMLSRLVSNDTQESIELTNRVVIEVHTASFRSVRGYTLLAVICDELAFWRSEDSASPDTEIIQAVRPGLATIPASLLLCISSPYARRGALWQAYQRHFGKDSSVLVWQADSRSMNPSLPESVVTDAMAEDEPAARAEWLAEFRRDIESFIDPLLVKSLVIPERRSLEPVADVIYTAFTDPAGGSGNDSYAVAIVHTDEQKRVIVDCIVEKRPPFSPEQTTEEFCDVLKRYGISRVVGDRFAGEWPREQFRKHGIHYVVSEQSKSEIYQNALPLFNSRRVELLDEARSVSQLCRLERRTARGGRDSIDHEPGGNDDVINCVCGAAVLASKASAVVTEFDNKGLSKEGIRNFNERDRGGAGYAPVLERVPDDDDEDGGESITVRIGF